ncbi:putative methylase [uncultured Caudovirales phage]|uniref:Putative methylase n=1 Tax=uncultured Caudovirales phage TaxID=2100421 RepID=A0A6J5LW07_9CAUD|nr:putative methylase [uncultured Caudovirales phage]
MSTTQVRKRPDPKRKPRTMSDLWSRAVAPSDASTRPLSADVRLCDARELLASLKDGSVDAVITDPPYGVDHEGNSAYDDRRDGWEARIASLLPEMLRVSRGSVLWFGASPTLHRDLAVLKPDRVMIWAPKFTSSKVSKGGVFYRWHTVFAWKTEAIYKCPTSHSLGVHSDHFNEMTAVAKTWWDHPATKPVPLMERLCRAAPPGGLVCDPFAGSGTTGVAAINVGRSFIGSEILPEYHDVATKRIAEALAPWQAKIARFAQSIS